MVSDRISRKAFFFSLGAVFAVESAGFYLLPVLKLPPLPAIGCVRILETVLLLFILDSQGGLFSSLGFRRRNFLRDIGRGLLWSGGFGLLVLAVFLLIHLFGGYPPGLAALRRPPDPFSFLLLLSVGAFLSPVAEEIFFRGILFGFFRTWGFVPALVLSTALFAFIHPAGQGFPVIQVIGGGLFAVAYEKEGTVVVPIVIHCLGNGALFLLSCIPRLF